MIRNLKVPINKGFSTIHYLFLIVFIGFTQIASAQLPQVPRGQRLKDLATQHHILIGGATELNHNDAAEEAIIKNEYSILSNENCLKPYKTEPSENVFDFSESDRFVKFCKDNGIIAKGHKLMARDGYLPKWMLDPKFSTTDLERILKNHIRTVMGRYKKGSPYGEIKYWDVLNEVNDYKNKPYQSVFEKIGKNSDGDFLFWEIAFRTARETDPDCILIWNEDNTEFDSVKAEKLYESVRRLKARGVPIDAVGFQCHIGLEKHPVPDRKYLAKIFQKFADLGLYIVITEMDVPDRLKSVKIYKDILKVFLEQPKCIIWNTWNVLDKYSWRNKEKDGFLLFDANYIAKPTYYAVQKVLKKANRKITAQRVLPVN